MRMTMPCGCKFESWTDAWDRGHQEFQYCPLHAAAPKLLEACKELLSMGEPEDEIAEGIMESASRVVQEADPSWEGSVS